MTGNPDVDPQPTPPDERPEAAPDTPEDILDMDSDGDGMRLISADVSCQNCAHRNICAVYSGIAPMFADWQAGDGEPPIDLDDLAVICKEYLPEEEL